MVKKNIRQGNGQEQEQVQDKRIFNQKYIKTYSMVKKSTNGDQKDKVQMVS